MLSLIPVLAEASEAGAAAADAPVVNQVAIFWIALALLALFIAYFAVEKVIPRRWVGTVLAAGVTAFTLYFFLTFQMPLGIELRGGVEFQLQIQEDGDKEITKTEQQQVIATLQSRLDANGVGEVNLTPQGDNRILLQMPAVTEEERETIRKILQTTAQLEIRMAHPQTSPFLVNRISEGEEFLTGYEVLPHRDEGGEAAVVEILKVVDGTQVANAYRALGPEGFMVSVQLKKKGGDRMFEATGKNLGKPMAIIVDDEIVSVATIRDRFGDSFVITGDYDQQEAEQLSSFLKNPLAKPIEVINETYVSPAMGQETIKQGFTAGIAGLCLTLLFVLFYYNLPGIVATIGLLVNVIIIFGLLSMFQFVLTMPGIAGVILTIGISIDANVLIYERLREEQKAGKSLKAALESAYGKAFSAIFDANVTTLIAAFLLLALATGTIKGFATTLIIGIFGSLFAALLVTKVLFGWLLDLGVIKKVNLWSILAVTKIDFLSYRRTAAFVSLALVAGAIALISVKQENVLGVGMRGGDLVTIASTEDLSLKQLEDSLTKASGLKAKPSVQEQKPLNQSATFFTVRTADDDGPIALNHLRSDLDAALADTQIESVGSQVGEEMFRKSLLALGIGMIFILFYVTFRFESIAFALGAIAAVLHDLVVTIGILALLGQEISLIMVGALLTIAGYSINDTIVVFDRLREGLKTQRGEVIDVMNFCLNATLSRTIITSMTTLIVVLTLFFFGGPALKEFALTLIIGVLIGTYSSIFVASPIVLWWARTRKLNLRREMLDAEASKVVGPASAANT